MSAHLLESLDSNIVLLHDVDLLLLESELSQRALTELAQCRAILCEKFDKCRLCDEILKVVCLAYNWYSKIQNLTKIFFLFIIIYIILVVIY